jgi:hypothetical protein
MHAPNPPQWKLQIPAFSLYVFVFHHSGTETRPFAAAPIRSYLVIIMYRLTYQPRATGQHVQTCLSTHWPWTSNHLVIMYSLTCHPVQVASMYRLVYIHIHLRLSARAGMSNLPATLHILQFLPSLCLWLRLALYPTRSVGNRQSTASDVQGRNVVKILLINLVEMELRPIESWPIHILCYLFVDLPNRGILKKLSALFSVSGNRTDWLGNCIKPVILQWHKTSSKLCMSCIRCG